MLICLIKPVFTVVGSSGAQAGLKSKINIQGFVSKCLNDDSVTALCSIFYEDGNYNVVSLSQLVKSFLVQFKKDS